MPTRRFKRIALAPLFAEQMRSYVWYLRLDGTAVAAA